MLAFYLDAALTRPVTAGSPKVFLIPEAGGEKTGSLWLGDPEAGTSYTFDGNIRIQPSPLVSLKAADETSYGFHGLPLLLPINVLTSGVANAVRVDLLLTLAPGAPAEFPVWTLETNGFVVTGAPGGTPRNGARAFLHVVQQDQGLAQPVRLLPLEREVGALPGFRIGEYRWRDRETINARALMPTRWDPNVAAIGIEKFIAGIGDNEDLKPVRIEEVQDSLFPRIEHGHYFSGPNGYFLPAAPGLEFLPGHILQHTLAAKAQYPYPVFVGTYQLDGQGFYEKDLDFRRVVMVPAGDLDYDWYHLEPSTRELTLSRALEPRRVFVGLFGGHDTEYFDLPVYPVDQVSQLFLDRGVNAALPIPNFEFDREQGTLIVQKPGAGTPQAGEPIYAIVNPAVAVLYETGRETTRVLPVDVNPAFAGIAGGYVYLQHRRHRPERIVLACDKPYIAVPPTHDTILGLVAHGPVYFDGDYALLTATAYSKVPNEVVPNVRLQVRVDPAEFTGLINYQDPRTETIEVLTGGDGTANLVFIPRSGFGVYLPTIAAAGNNGGLATTTFANDTLVLPEGVPISQIWSEDEGWLVTAYTVYKTNPLFGTIADPLPPGAIAWATDGTPGTVGYRTNGMREPWRTGKTLVRPIQALDASGYNYDDPLFSGTVKALVFDEAVNAGPTVGAYFVTYVQRVTLQLAAPNSNVISNTLLLEMAVPEVVDDNPWLVVDDDFRGKLNQFRLGWQNLASFPV